MNLYPFGKAVAGFFARLIFRIKYEGLENIPGGGGYILACNHPSNFDPIIIAQPIPVMVRYMAKVQLTRIPVAGWVIARLGIIPVMRGENDGGVAIGKAIEAVRQGSVLGVFPEGRRNLTDKPLRPRSGVGLIAGQTGADVLPMAISYSNGRRPLSRITVRYGQMIPNTELGVDAASPATMRKASRLVMDNIIALMEPPPNTGEESSG